MRQVLKSGPQDVSSRFRLPRPEAHHRSSLKTRPHQKCLAMRFVECESYWLDKIRSGQQGKRISVCLTSRGPNLYELAITATVNSFKLQGLTNFNRKDTTANTPRSYFRSFLPQVESAQAKDSILKFDSWSRSMWVV